MIVKSKENNKLYTVESIQNDKNGYPHFLIFDYYEKDEWTWISAKKFVKASRWDLYAKCNYDK